MADPLDDGEGSTNEAPSTERFIQEVKSHPAIWDINSAEYANRLEKLKAWEKLCGKLIPNFASLDSKARIKEVMKLQKRWKGLRSSYNREKKKHKQRSSHSHSSKHHRKEYQYFSQLSFLSGKSRRNPSETVSRDLATDTELQESEECESDATKTQKKIEKKQDMGRDYDLNFLHSLLPHFKRVRDEFKLDLQSEILGTLKKYRRIQRGQDYPTEYTRHYSRPEPLDIYSRCGYLSASPTTSIILENTIDSPADTFVSHGSDIIKTEVDFD